MVNKPWLYVNNAYIVVVIVEVEISKHAQKQLERIPIRIVKNLQFWVQSVIAVGLEEVRRIPGYHDEPLKGDRTGQRSIRLSRSYRAIYEIRKDNSIKFVLVEEVSKHRY